MSTFFLKSRFGPLLLLALAMAALYFLAGSSSGSSYILRVVALVWVMALAAVGLHVLMGLAGQISLGHAGFFGIGAYTMAVLPGHYGVPVPLAVLAGIALSAVTAYLVGKPILRLKGHYLAIATLGFSLLVGLVITSEIGMTGGPDGSDVVRLRVFGEKVTSPAAWYAISATLLVIGIGLAIQLRNSPTGRALRSVLDSEVAAASMGIDVARRKIQAFVIAAVYATVAGSVFALMNGFITPDLASFMMSVEFVAMVVIGGVTTPFGALVGAALLSLLPQLMATLHDYQDILLGLIIMLAMIFLRSGIVPTLANLFTRRKS